VGRDIRG